MLILSICITSYNRPKELIRCLNSILTTRSKEIEIIVRDDCSPKKIDILNSVQDLIKKTHHKLSIISGNRNIGFDENFKKVMSLAHGKYILMMTDDDEIIPGSIDILIPSLKREDFAAAYTPYFDVNEGQYRRNHSQTIKYPKGLKSASTTIYNSILLSGLLFKRSLIPFHDLRPINKSIYSQVYVFSSLIYLHGGMYINVPIVRYIGDGQNGFGKNEAGETNRLLQDRKNHLSNIEYHKGLIKVIKYFDSKNETTLYQKFEKLYNLRTYVGLKNARILGRKELIEYYKMLQSLEIDISWITKTYFFLLKTLGFKITEFILSIPKAIYVYGARFNEKL